MSLIGNIAISMGLDYKAFTKGLGSVRKELNAFAGNMQVVGAAILGFGAVGAIALGKVVTAAADVQEQTDRVRDQFDIGSQKVIDFADNMATAFGVAKKETLASTAGFAAIFKGAGYADAAIADLSIHMNRLATDASRFVNMPVTEALEKLHSGLAGNARPLKDLGISVLDADVKARGLKLGLQAVDGELSQAQKVYVRTILITEGLAKAQGNLAKTGDKTAGAIEAVKGRFENLAATIGDSFLLIAAPALMEVQLGIQSLSTYWAESARIAVEASGQTIGGLQAEHETIGVIQTAIGYIADAWQIALVGFHGFQLGITTGLTGILLPIKHIGEAIIAVGKMLPGIIDPNLGLALTAQFDEMSKLMDKQIDALGKEMGAEWAHVTVNAGFAQARKDIAEARERIKAMGVVDPSKIIPDFGLGADATKGKHGTANTAQLFGSQEAANTILRSQFGTSASGPAEKTAANTAQTNVILNKMLQALGNTFPGNLPINPVGGI